MDTGLSDSQAVTPPSSHLAGEGRAAEAVGPLFASPPLGLQSLGPGEELAIPREMSQEALGGDWLQQGAEGAALAPRWAAPALDRGGPAGGGRPAPPRPRSLAPGQQRVGEQRGGLHPGPHRGGDSRGEQDLGRSPPLWLRSLETPEMGEGGGGQAVRC